MLTNDVVICKQWLCNDHCSHVVAEHATVDTVGL